MYESHFSLHESPFSLRPDPAYYFIGQKVRLAMAQLEYALLSQSAGQVLVTGDAGAGKTTLVRRLVALSHPDLCIGLLFQCQSTWIDTLRWILLAFGLAVDSHDELILFERLVVHCNRENEQSRRCVLVVDEAHLLSDENLERLRILGNINADSSDLLQIVLVGQSELRQRLQQPQWIALCQRIVADIQLSVLSEAEVLQYITHRVDIAGGSGELFSEDAMRLIARASGGVPRIINSLCDTALLFTYAESQSQVSGTIVSSVIRDRRGGVIPIMKNDG